MQKHFFGKSTTTNCKSVQSFQSDEAHVSFCQVVVVAAQITQKGPQTSHCETLSTRPELLPGNTSENLLHLYSASVLLQAVSNAAPSALNTTKIC